MFNENACGYSSFYKKKGTLFEINARLWPTDPEANRKHIKDYKLFYIEETGHFPMMEKPEDFNTLLKEALAYTEAK